MSIFVLMKHLLFITFLLSCATAFAQKKQSTTSVYVDAGCTTRGASVAYDARLSGHLQLGAAVDVYDWRITRINLRTSVYADLRPYWQFRHSQLFVPLDLGVAFYSEHEQPFYNTVAYSHVGLHLSFGIGYCYQITKRGSGPYATFIMKGYTYTETEYDRYNEKRILVAYDATSLISVGFKF